MKFNTALLHGNFSPDDKTGATTIPIYQSSAFTHGTAEELENIFKGRQPGFVYTRVNNPTIDSLEKRIAYIEGGIGAAAYASGMSAVSFALLNILKSGDEILSGSGIFGGTHSLFNGFEDYGITAKYAKGSSIESYEECINESTKVIYVETIGNPKLDVANISELAGLAHKYSIPLVVDNTVTTPYLVKPLSLGADIVVHSTSKYINGSGNSIGGIIVDGGKFKWDLNKFPSLKAYKKYGPFMYLAKLRNGLAKDMGACMAPFNAYLNSLGLETLALRMDRLCSNALELAKYLQSNQKVVSVNYPGLDGDEYQSLAKEQFGGKYGAILTIRVGSKENAFKLINSLKYAINIANIGDTRTLVIHPASTICAHDSIEDKENMGVYEDLIRISVGLEDIEDLIEDFTQALNTI
jgi:O-acetylhomoserine (thiol)-lyase